MNNKFIDWLAFIALSFIWGSSFILMKVGLVCLTSFQVASVRIITSGLVLMPIALRSIKQLPRQKLLPVFLSGVLGSLLPAYFFCIAEEKIDSALAGTLNSLTPIFVIVNGALFFNVRTSGQKLLGVLIAFAGSIFLYLAQPVLSENNYSYYLLFIILSTFCYGMNVQLVHRYLQAIPSLNIVATALFLCAIPASVVLSLSGFFSVDFSNACVLKSVAFSCLLGIGGTAMASLIFYMLIKRAGTVFSSMVTYGIPFVAMMWGVIYGEKVGLNEIFCLLLILAGVYIANRKREIN